MHGEPTRSRKRESDGDATGGASVDKHVKLRGARVRSVRYKLTYTCRTLPTALSYKRSTPANVNASVVAAPPPLLCFCPKPIYSTPPPGAPSPSTGEILIVDQVVFAGIRDDPANTEKEKILVKFLRYEHEGSISTGRRIARTKLSPSYWGPW